VPTTYDPVTPVLTGDSLAISRFLKSPAMIERAIRDLAKKRFIADVILTGRATASGGAIMYGISESSYTDRAPEAVAAGGDYPKALAVPGAAALAKISKWGQEVEVTDESVGRTNLQPIQKGMLKVVNQMVKQVDGVALATIGAAVTQTQAAAAAWSSAAADPFLDAMLAIAQVRALDEGYDPTALVLTDILYTRLVANQKVIAGLRRESTNTVTETGQVLQIANLTLLPTNNLPAGVSAMVLDTAQLGGIGIEEIPSPEYSGDPKTGIETYVYRDKNDKTVMRGRRPVVPFVQEPNSAVKLTGV